MVVFAHTLTAFGAAYFLLGLGMACGWVGDPTFRIAITPEAKRHTYLAVMSLLTLPGMLVCSALGAALWTAHGGTAAWGAGFAAVLAILSLATLLKIKPRE